MISVLAATCAILALRMSGAYQFTPFEVGQVKAHLHHEMNPADIARIVLKPDGKTHYSVTTIHNIIDKLNNDPMWRGERQAGSGASRQTTAKQDALIAKEVFPELFCGRAKRDREEKTLSTILIKKITFCLQGPFQKCVGWIP